MKATRISKYLFLSFLLLLTVIACKKDSEPASRPNPAPIDESYSQYGEPFKQVPSTPDIVMYEVNLRAFSADGDLPGVINRLDDLQNLGVNVIWLMPMHPIGEVNSVNSPYSVKDFKAVSSEYGSLADLRLLVEEAHTRGMAVIMDWVANHTAWDNAWITNKSWYTQDSDGNIVHPPGTNWLDVADLNFDNATMRANMIDAMKYWTLEANVDGFRCDYADGVPFDFWKEAFDTLRSIPNRDLIFLAEGGRSDHFEAGFDINFGWNFYGALKGVFASQSANRMWNVHNEEYENVSGSNQFLRFTTNHDESAWDATPMTLFNGKEGALAASSIAIFMGGVPLIYTGQEVGRVSTVPFFSNSPINWNANPEMLQEYQDLLAFYNKSAVARRGSNTNYPDVDVVAFKKTLNGDELLVISNTRNQQLSFQLPSALQNSSWTNPFDSSTVSLGSSLLLEEYQYLILEN